MTERKRTQERELIVKFRKGANADQKTRALRNAATVKNIAVRGQLGAAKAPGGAAELVNRIQVREGMEMDAELARLRSNPAVEYAEPNYPVKLMAVTNAEVIPTSHDDVTGPN